MAARLIWNYSWGRFWHRGPARVLALTFGREKIRFKISDEKLPKLPKLRQNLGKGTINVRKIEFDGTFGLGAK